MGEKELRSTEINVNLFLNRNEINTNNSRTHLSLKVKEYPFKAKSMLWCLIKVHRVEPPNPECNKFRMILQKICSIRMIEVFLWIETGSLTIRWESKANLYRVVPLMDLKFQINTLEMRNHLFFRISLVSTSQKQGPAGSNLSQV